LSTLTMTGSTLAGNTAGAGGGLFNQASMTLVNDTIANNTADQGGGINTFGFCPARLTNRTIWGQPAAQEGGGIFVGIGDPNVLMKNTLVALNTAVTGPDIQGTVVSQGHNLIGDGTGGSGFTDTDFVGTSDAPIDPLLGPLQDNGGPTQTHRPAPGDPATGLQHPHRGAV